MTRSMYKTLTVKTTQAQLKNQNTGKVELIFCVYSGFIGAMELEILLSIQTSQTRSIRMEHDKLWGQRISNFTRNV